jgi:hypothetical protein
MKTYKYVKQLETIKAVDQIICDKCGKVIPIDSDNAWFSGGQVSINCGYGSKFDSEFDGHNFDLCDECVVELSKSLKWVSPWDSITQEEAAKKE